MPQAPTLVPVRKRSDNSLASYPVLIKRVRATLLSAQLDIEALKIRTSWLIGQDINSHIKIHGGRSTERVLSIACLKKPG